MNKTSILVILIVLIGLVSCSNEYSEYKAIPNYISNHDSNHKLFFKAYDKALNLWKTPYEELYIPTQFGTAHVVVSGSKNGMPVVLLHGMNASSTMWYPNVKAISENYRVYAIDFILEPGKSFLTKEMKSDQDIAIWYREVFDKLNLKSFCLIGASRGGWIAVKTALYNQKNINSVVLLSPAQTFTWIRPSSDLLKNIIYSFASKDKKMEKQLSTLSEFPQNINKTYLNQYNIAIEKDSINKFMIDMTPFSKEELQSLKMPVYVLIGDDDMINSEKTIEKTKEILPYGRGEIISNAGHFLSLDQSEVVNEKIILFLKEMEEVYQLK